MPDLDAMMKRQQVLADFGDLAIRSEDLDEVLTEACRLVAIALGTGRAKVLEIQDDGRTLFLRAGVGWDRNVVGRVRLPMSERSSETYSIEQSSPVVMQDTAEEHRFDVPPFMRAAGIVAFVNVPIFVPRARPYGILQVDSTAARQFDDDDIQFLRTYASVLGPVVDRLKLADERRVLEEKRENDVGALRVLQQVSTEMVGERDPQELYQSIVRAAAALMRSDAASLQILEERSQTLKLQVWQGFHESSARFWQDVRADTDSSCGQALRTGRRTGIPDMDRFDGAADELDAYRRSGILSGQSTPLRAFTGQVVGMLSTHWHDRRTPAASDYHYFDVLARLAADLIERVQASRQLRDSEARQRTLMEGIPQLVWRSDVGGEWTWANPQWSSFTGQSTREYCGRGWLEAIHPDDRAETLQAWQSAAEAGELDLEHRVRRGADGDWIWHHTRSLPVRDSEGHIVEWLGTSTDIQGLRELQQHQDVLVAELQHRTRNLMGVFRSMTFRMLATSEDLADFRERFRDRIDALARVQGLLARLEENDRLHFDELLRAELSAINGGLDKVVLDGPAGIRLRSSTVQILALALHELATNALKYGALGTGDGRLTIRWSVSTEPDRGARTLDIDWHETQVDIGSRTETPGTGHGRELIEVALPYQLGAKTRLSFEPDGVRCRIAIPVSAAAAG